MDMAMPAWENAGMTYPRSHLVSEDESGCYHVVSRCVRRAFLCGKDKLTGKCFEHRRNWIESRILELAECFAVSVFAYAVMSNHFHVVLHVDPTEAQALSDEEVAKRWLKAFPGPLKHDDDPELAERFELAILGNPERLTELRKRLGSLSWFMKALNEPIARQANREDDCTHGRSFRRRYFRFAKTAPAALPVLASSGRVGSNARPCSNHTPCCHAWPTWISTPSGQPCAKPWLIPITLRSNGV
ncbi:MAG: hypothetical protein EA418_14465 [Wenzhouxiangellaceae bacterium]|nr:MAG: hypothetical protein EA418_14465 [Wenzhouxiangellaceae bacterium]